jgi:hypothetical protein
VWATGVYLGFESSVYDCSRSDTRGSFRHNREQFDWPMFPITACGRSKPQNYATVINELALQNEALHAQTGSAATTVTLIHRRSHHPAF